MAYEISAELQTKIDEVNAKQAAFNAKVAAVQAHNETVAADLASAKLALKDAILDVSNSPNETTRAAEVEARNKVAQLEAENEGALERASAVYQSGTEEIQQLRRSVILLARQELRANYDAQKPAALQRIEMAKKEYMDSLLALHELTMVDTQGKYYDISREIGLDVELAKQTEPGVGMHEPLLTYRSPGFNYYGMFSDEILEAFKRGNLKKGAVRE